MINKQRMIDEFLKMVRIDSESGNEEEMAAYLSEILAEKFGATVDFDSACDAFGGNCGNLIAHLEGEGDDYFLLSSHMDTVKPGVGVNPVIEGDLIKSDGTTVLGADDKSGIAIILEAIRALKEDGAKHLPLEIVFTAHEEGGLQGSKHMDSSKLKAKMGLCLDDHHVGDFTVGAPGKNGIDVKIHGLEAHAGVEPQNGISAITVASKAIAKMTQGKVDDETAANVGIISGGSATNVVPNLVAIECEARSRNNDKLENQTAHMVGCFESAAAEAVITVDGEEKKARAEINVSHDYDAFALAEDSPLRDACRAACEKHGIEAKFVIGLGGSDANFFNAYGVDCAMMGTGMQKVHTTAEYVSQAEMVKGAELLYTMLKVD